MDLLPAIDILGGRAVRLAKGDYNAVTVYNEDPVEQAREFAQAGAKWIHVVDLDGARTGVPENIALVQQIACIPGVQVETGGGVRSLETIDQLAEAGVARVVLGSKLVKDKQFALDAIERFGGLLCAGIDARDGEVAIEGWREGAGVSAHELAAEMAQMGYEHLVYTDIARDGMQTGIDEAAYARMAEVFGHAVIASGGVATIDDVQRLAQVAGSIEGIITGRAVYEGSLDVREALDVCRGAQEQ